jgi:hypothetical protein
MKLGEKKAKKLYMLAKETKKITNFELLEMIEHYKNLNASLTSS